MSKVKLPRAIETMIRDSTQSYGKVKLVLQRNRYWIESAYPVRVRTNTHMLVRSYRPHRTFSRSCRSTRRCAWRRVFRRTLCATRAPDSSSPRRLRPLPFLVRSSAARLTITRLLNHTLPHYTTRLVLTMPRRWRGGSGGEQAAAAAAGRGGGRGAGGRLGRSVVRNRPGEGHGASSETRTALLCCVTFCVVLCCVV